MIGTGMGIIGLAATIAVDYESGNFSIARYYSLGTAGVVLSVAARMAAGKDEQGKPNHGQEGEKHGWPEEEAE